MLMAEGLQRQSAASHSPALIGLHRFAQLTAAATFLLLIAGEL